jgi:hypothetical protein
MYINKIILFLLVLSQPSRLLSIGIIDTTRQDMQKNGLSTRNICVLTITKDTRLDEDLICPPNTQFTIVFGAPNITLDLGGHVLKGTAPSIGVFAQNKEGITIRNGTIEGFEEGIAIFNTPRATVENLTIKNLAISDPNHFIFGVHIDGSRDVIVRDMQFEFITVAHKSAIEIYNSYVDVNNIEVRGGGVGVSFSFAGVCDPVNSPSNGTVRNSKFSDIKIAGIWIACCSSVLIEANDFSSSPGSVIVGEGIQGDASFLGAVTGLTVKENFIHNTVIGVEFRGITKSSISNNYIFDNQAWGIAIRQSLGCLNSEPHWECFYSTANVIADNETWGNGTDLYHFEKCLSNAWERNTCETKDGSEIPECTRPNATLVINYASGKPGSFFTLKGANFPSSSTAIITVNGAMLGNVSTDSYGDLVFLINTDRADEGDYIVTATVNLSTAARFVLDSRKLIRPQEGQGTILKLVNRTDIEDLTFAFIPTKFELLQNYPNPFNPLTNIEYDIAKAGNVNIYIYDILGKKVGVLLDGFIEAGRHKIVFDGSNYSSGIYFYRIIASNYSLTKKLTLIK